jgi:hypothetical protein
MNKINWDFIGAREGRKLRGYVPPAGHSGVTIATGFDIGNASAATIASLPEPLAAKLAPYHGLVRIAALHMLQLNPLVITDEEADTIDSLTEGGVVSELEAKFKEDASADFDTLPEQAQTVIASVTFQYGTPWTKTPHFWGHCVKQDWQAVHADLENFGDDYAPRRKLEADYLAPLLKEQSNEPHE